jgi:hypothetical protein
MKWNPNGKNFVALDKNGLVVVYPPIEYPGEKKMMG